MAVKSPSQCSRNLLEKGAGITCRLMMKHLKGKVAFPNPQIESVAGAPLVQSAGAPYKAGLPLQLRNCVSWQGRNHPQIQHPSASPSPSAGLFCKPKQHPAAFLPLHNPRQASSTNAEQIAAPAAASFAHVSARPGIDASACRHVPFPRQTQGPREAATPPPPRSLCIFCFVLSSPSQSCCIQDAELISTAITAQTCLPGAVLPSHCLH